MIYLTEDAIQRIIETYWASNEVKRATDIQECSHCLWKVYELMKNTLN